MRCPWCVVTDGQEQILHHPQQHPAVFDLDLLDVTDEVWNIDEIEVQP